MTSRRAPFVGLAALLMAGLATTARADGALLRDGRVIPGRLVSATRLGDLVVDRGALGPITLTNDLVASIELNEPPSAAPAGPHLLVMDDGTRLRVALERIDGRVVRARWESLTLECSLDRVQRLALDLATRPAPPSTGEHLELAGTTIPNGRAPLAAEGLAIDGNVVRCAAGEWPLASLRALHRPPSPAAARPPIGHHARVVVDAQQHLVGVLAGIDARTVVLETPGFGRLEIPREKVWRLAWGPSSGAGDRGPTLVAQSHGKRVELFDGDGVSLWRIEGLKSPHDAERIATGEILMVEYQGGSVSKRWPGGKVAWEVTGLANPIDADALPGGGVLVAEFGKNRVIELDRAGQIAWKLDTLKNPNEVEPVGDDRVLVCDSGNKRVVIIERATGKIVWTLDKLQWPMDADWLGNGRVLVTDNSAGVVYEVDATGKTVWEHACNNPYEADRLPNGNTLIVETGRRRVIELTPDKRVVWTLDGLDYPAAAVRD